MRRTVGGRVLVYTIPVRNGRELLFIYLKLARRAMGLLPEHGVPDENFVG